MEDMNRKWGCLSLIVGLTLLVLPVSGCVQGDRKPEASTVAGRVVLAQEQAAGLAGASLLVVDDTSSYVATNEEGYFETAALSGTVIIPRKTGYRFVPERQVGRQDRSWSLRPIPGQNLILPIGASSFPSPITWIGLKRLPFLPMIDTWPPPAMIAQSESGEQLMDS